MKRYGFYKADARFMFDGTCQDARRYNRWAKRVGFAPISRAAKRIHKKEKR